jgi:serine O-acetyltransferase
MIQSKKDYYYYFEADRVANSIPLHPSLLTKIKHILLPNYIWIFLKTLRKLEYYKNCGHGLFGLLGHLFYARKYNKLSVMLGFTIPANVFGPGLALPHHGTVVVNGGAKVGENCRIHACTNIGTAAGYSNKAPKIGNNCYIGPGVKIFGDISIENGTALGANSVVNQSFSEENIAIAGVPAKKIGGVDTLDMLIPATQIIALGLNKSDDLIGLPAKKVKVKISQHLARGNN